MSKTKSADPEEEKAKYCMEKAKMAPKNDPTIEEPAVDEADLQEMQDVNNSLDELSSALDFFEQRTDNMIEQLKELLHSNREIRQQLANENAAAAAVGDVPKQ